MNNSIHKANIDATVSANNIFEIGQSDPMCIQIIWSGVVAVARPTIDILVSNDGVNFSSLGGTLPVTMTEVSDNFVLIQESTPYRYINIAYANTNSSAGTYTISIVKK